MLTAHFRKRPTLSAATLPAGTTHYLIDENNFLVSHPGGFKKDGRDKQYSEYALKARPPQK